MLGSKMTHITKATMEILDIFDPPESKPTPNVMREIIEPRAEIWRRGFLPNRCNKIKMNPRYPLRKKYLDQEYRWECHKCVDHSYP